MRSPIFAALAPALARLPAERFPTHDELTAAASGVTTSRAMPVRFVKPRGNGGGERRYYELRIAETGEVETRADNWHDFFNALAWITWPRAKAAINAQHAAILEERGDEEAQRRSPQRDALTLFDEGGAVVASSAAELLGLVGAFEWKELFWRRRRELEQRMRFFAFGHGFCEQALAPYLGMVAKTVYVPADDAFLALPCEAQVARADALVAAHFADRANFPSPRAMAPMPVLGVPGWHPDTAIESFYDDAKHFRSKERQPHGHGRWQDRHSTRRRHRGAMVKSLWSDAEAAGFPGDLGQRVYTSRLLGRDKSLVLHGGGNTSVKVASADILGRPQEVLYVKGSGWDLEQIEEAGFSPVRLDHLVGLAKLDALSDPMMVNEMRTHMLRADAPTPSVEAILHAILPFKYVDHTHSDAILAITNTADGEKRIRALYGDEVVVIAYVMPGFDLARLCAQVFPRDRKAATIGMVLLNHGIFSFGATARESYERMIALVDKAERALATECAVGTDRGQTGVRAGSDPGLSPRQLAALRGEVSRVAGAPMIVATHGDAASVAFARRDDVAAIACRGPATPDHVLRTKRIPMVGRDVEAYAREYAAYFAEHAKTAREPKTMLDPAPRVILDPALGVATVGRTAKDAQVVFDIYEHTMQVIQRAQGLGGWQALPAKDIFDVEYWDLEQAKLAKGGATPAFTGEVVLVTGAASGIGKACVKSFLARGCAVIALDLNAAVEKQEKRADFLGIACDITQSPQLATAIERGVRAFGGLDMVVLNAGIFPAGTRIEALGDREWDRVMRVNLDANLALLRESHALLKLAPRGGRVVVIGSKNVPAPGPGAAAYSASKAALAQLARVAALEWGADGIRINMLNPNAVFDTGIWTEEVLAERAKHYGLSVEAYKRNNVLKVEVTSRDVAELAAELCGPLFAKTTGAQVPVDGGNDRVI